VNNDFKACGGSRILQRRTGDEGGEGSHVRGHQNTTGLESHGGALDTESSPKRQRGGLGRVEAEAVGQRRDSRAGSRRRDVGVVAGRIRIGVVGCQRRDRCGQQPQS